MSLDLVPLHPEFGVVVRGVDLARDLSDALFADIELAAECHSVVLFRGQDFDDRRQLAFSERLGALEFDYVAYGQEGRIDYIGVIRNIDQQGRRMPLEHKQVVFSTGNYMWHSEPGRCSTICSSAPPGRIIFTSTAGRRAT